MLGAITESGILGAFAVGGVIGVIIVSAVGVLVVNRKLRNFSREVFGTDSIIDGINLQADLAAERPKSVSSMTRLMEPQIAQDFPEFSWEEFRGKAENMLISALGAISAGDASKLTNASEDIKRQISTRIDGNKREGIKEVYRQVKIHQTEIANYEKSQGQCIVTLQSSMEYYYYKERDGQIIAGTKDRKTQTKYNTQLMYIQDVKLLNGKSAVGTTCPNCGAPVTSLGAKFCEYCGSHVIPVNIKVWSLHNFYEVDYNHTY